ncbi:MAG: preprotein translocase subunit SecA [Planctomycetota bacterium]|nr:MAG: preprotein translocase subunit SecA [Planctomycetota bacterium]
MSSRLGTKWVNRVNQIAVGTYRSRFGKYAIIADQVNALEPEYSKFTDKRLLEESKILRMKARQGDNINKFVTEAFALVREAAKRVLGQRHYDVQLVGGAAIHFKNIAEMETGEGKTLVATLPTFLNALPGKGVHLVTVNDYLAKRDADEMGQVYKMLGMTVGCIITDMSDGDRRAAYSSDITYGTSKEFGFDFLRDELKRLSNGGEMFRKNFEQAFLGKGTSEGSQPVQRGHFCAIVDEADSVLIDEARTPLIIGVESNPDHDESAAFFGADEIALTLVRDKHFKWKLEEKKAELTGLGRRAVQMRANHSAFSAITVDTLYEHVERALKANIGFLRDRDYVVMDGEVVIVDESTGRVMPGRQWQDGLHGAVQAKEKLEFKGDTYSAARVTVQDFFLRYKKLSGMTGTAWQDSRELRKIYKIGVFRVPTNMPSKRVWAEDRVFSTELEKFEAVANKIVEINRTGGPVLVGTRSIAKSELLSQLLRERDIDHQVLNAKNHAIEAQIVAQAGQKSKVTVATNMAGRGTDIKLGGGVADNGGLHVIGTERHESRRIDRQLAGRCARQGDPGFAQFFICLEDEILDAFTEKKADKIRDRHEGRGELTNYNFKQLMVRAQYKKERQHYKDRMLLMHYEKQRAEMRTGMGLNPVLG